MGKECQALPHTYVAGALAGFIAYGAVGGHRLLQKKTYIRSHIGRLHLW